ncbi:MAG: 50S ribosomal protein L25 [Planctomycetota bacterium]|nr:50S ribosomal protein L25 [Planctomycetota bacterium]MDA1262507.1 50S ribosomal protein L25 [Planctomycetota bacterium]
MSHEVPVLDALPRERLGTRYAKRLRTKGQLPAVIYGHGSQPTPVSVDEKTMLSALRRGLHVFEVKVNGGTSETCLVKELQFGWMGDNVIHVDLTRVNLDEEVTVSVAINFIGVPDSAKRVGAVLTHDISELELRCKVRDIPESIRVDLTNMAGDLMTVAQLKLAAGLTAVSNPHSALARVVLVLEEATGEAATTAVAAAEPEVLTAKKEDPAAAGDDKKADKKT